MLGGAKQLNAGTIWQGYKDIVSDPVNWVAGASILAASYKSLLKGTLSNAAAREWYLAREAEIPSMLNTKQPLEQQTKQAFNLRNQIRTEAGELMADRKLAEKFNQNDPNMTWYQVVEKYKGQGYLGDGLWNR